MSTEKLNRRDDSLFIDPTLLTNATGAAKLNPTPKEYVEILLRDLKVRLADPAKLKEGFETTIKPKDGSVYEYRLRARLPYQFRPPLNIESKIQFEAFAKEVAEIFEAVKEQFPAYKKTELKLEGGYEGDDYKELKSLEIYLEIDMKMLQRGGGGLRPC